MKKRLLSILLALTVVALCACSESAAGRYTVINFDDAVVHDNLETEVVFSSLQASYYPYKNAEELTESADLVITGRVTNISFAVLDEATGLPPTKETYEKYRWLNTIYDIDVITTYKGEPLKSAQMKVMGGIRDYRVDEQLALIKEMDAYPSDRIFIEEIPEIKIGGIYLFTLRQFETGLPVNMTPHQTVYNLSDPFKKQGFHEIENPAEYYSRSTGPYESNIMSAYDVISVFGKDKWDGFWTDWQRDNPDWDTWMDKAAVEKVLAES